MEYGQGLGMVRHLLILSSYLRLLRLVPVPGESSLDRLWKGERNFSVHRRIQLPVFHNYAAVIFQDRHIQDTYS